MSRVHSQTPVQPQSEERLIVSDFDFTVQRSAKRRAVEIVVERDGALRLLAPVNTEAVTLEAVVRRRMEWIAVRKREAQKAAASLRPTRTYEIGECFYFLGLPRHLLLVNERGRGSEKNRPLRLEGDRFLLRCGAQERAEALFTQWYATQGREWLPERIAAWSRRVGVEVVEWQLRDLGFRWASARRVARPQTLEAFNPAFDVAGRLYFHWQVMMLPPATIEYLIAHETIHLHIPNHSSAFWKRLEMLCPDYREHQRWLLDQGARLL